LIDVKSQKTHGGSMRYVVARKNEYKIKKSVNKKLKYESDNFIDSIKGCMIFKKNCEISKKRIKQKITAILKSGKNIAGYAATSKSTTLLNYCGINHKHISILYVTRL
jgi:methylation protein EvaC